MAKTMITIMLMYDNGKSRTMRISNFFYKTICISFFILPLLLGLSIAAGYHLWEQNRNMSANALHLQIETNKAKALAANLSTFQELLSKDHSINSSAILVNQAEELSETMEQQAKDAALKNQDGPGHVEFPAVDTKEIVIENLNARILESGKIRISLDLRNPNPQKMVSGYVNCLLIDSNGITHNLDIAKDLMDFKIIRFKRVVFLPDISSDMLGEQGNILIEVYNDEKKLMYRNITPVEQ